MKDKCKAQISVEFIIIAAAALAVFLIVFAIIDQRNDELYSTRTMLYAKQEADKLASSINTMLLAGDGAQKKVYLPESLTDGTNYSIEVYPSNHLVEIVWGSTGRNKHYTATLITSNISGSLTSLRNTTMTISSSNGGIIIG